MSKFRLCNRLKVARAEKNLSQEQLGVLAGVTRQTISSIETGQYNPSALLALLLNGAGLLWACGIAMRFRTIQAGPLMQMPVFLLLFLAPVYVPLDLLTGWIYSVARFNPASYLLEAARGLIAGEPVYVGLAFGLGIALAAGLTVWALRGLRSAEAAGA